MKNRRKAISNLVSSVILIAIVLAVSAFVIYFVQSTMQTAAETGGIVEITYADFKSLGASSVMKVSFKNLGGYPVEFDLDGIVTITDTGTYTGGWSSLSGVHTLTCDPGTICTVVLTTSSIHPPTYSKVTIVFPYTVRGQQFSTEVTLEVKTP